MRKFKNNDKGVSTVVGYLFSLAVASMVMVSSIIITNNVIDEKKSQVATIEAQRIANYVSNAITEAVVTKQSMPEADYHRKLELPSTIGGMTYGIEVSDTTVSVVSSGGRVLATSSTYNTNELGVDIVNNIVYGSDIEISSEGSQFVRTYDFGSGDSFSHSPVGAGSFRVDTYRLGYPSVVGQPLWQDANSPNRLPIVVENPSDHNIEGATVKIVLNTSNFDYDNVTVIPQSKTDGSSSGGAGSKKTEGGSSDGDVIFADQFESDMRIYEYAEVPGTLPDTELTATVVFPAPWYRHWELGIGEDVYTYGGVKTRDRDSIVFTITGINPGNIPLANVIWNSITLKNLAGNSVKCFKYTPSTGEAYFGQVDVFENLILVSGSPSDGSTFNFVLEGCVVSSGEVKMFTFASSVQIKYGDIYVDGDNGDDGYSGTSGSPVATIQRGIELAELAGSGKTVYIRERWYSGQPYTVIGDTIEIVIKPVILVGEYSNKGDLPTVSISGELTSNYMIHISGGNDVSGTRVIMLKFFGGGSDPYGEPPGSPNNCDGLVLQSCSNVVVSKCYFHDNNGHGIKITNANNNVITNCKSFNNLGYLGNSRTGNGLLIDGSNSYRNCIMDSHFYGQSGSNSEGILLDNGAHSNTIIRCNVYWQFGADGDGIVLEDGAHDNRIIDCEIYDNDNQYGDGIEITSGDSSSSPTMNNEIVDCNISGHNGQGADGIQISSEESALPWCPDCHKVPKFINITGCHIYDNGQSGVASGIYLYYTTDINITDCEIDTIYGAGIWATLTSRNSIKNCIIHDIDGPIDEDALNIGYGDGIVGFNNFLSNRIENCDIFNNKNDGIHLREGNFIHGPDSFSTRDNTITKCRVHDNIYGVGINFTNTIRNTISQCDIYRNYLDGIYMEGGDPDIGQWDSEDPPDPGNIVMYCNIFANGDDGIHLWGSLATLGRLTCTKIHNNNFYSNGMSLNGADKTACGIFLAGSLTDRKPVNSRIYCNNFLHKTAGDYCAYDITDKLAHQNWWDNGVDGNYWCDLGSSTIYGNPRFIYGECDPWPPNPGRDPCMLDCVGSNGRYKIDPHGAGPLICGNWNDGYDDDNPFGPNHPIVSHRNFFPNPSTVLVEPSGSPVYDCPNITQDIQDAINRVIDGGTVYVIGSTTSYTITGTIGISKSLRLIGLPNDAGVYPTIKFADDIPDMLPEPSDFKTLITITGMSQNPSVAQKTIFIENLTIDGKQSNGVLYARRGISIDISNPSTSDDYVSISNCVIQNILQVGNGCNGEAIYINENKVSVKNCTLNNNKYGIYYNSGTESKIIGCSFDGNQEYGVYLAAGAFNNKIYHNYFGLNIENGKDAKNLGSNNQWDNDYPSGGNRWKAYDGYDDGARDIKNGNPQTLIGGDGIADIKYAIEGGGWDYFPFGGTVSDEDAIPPPSPPTEKLFAIDYWNPYGESVLLVKLSIGAGEKQKLYLYYGGGKNNVETDSIGNVAEFYDTFDSAPLSLAKWNFLGGGSQYVSSDGVLDLKRIPTGGMTPPTIQHIISKWFIPQVDPPAVPSTISHAVNEELYLVEASIKLNDSFSSNQGSLILAYQSNANYQNAYLTTLNVNASLGNNMSIHKRKMDGTQREINLKTANLSNSLNDWVRIKSYIYVSRNIYKTSTVPLTDYNRTDIVEINNTLFDLASFSEFNQSSYVDGYNTKVPGGSPSPILGDNDGYDPWFTEGWIGIGCGLLQNLPPPPSDPTIDSGSVLVDWIRVLKMPLVSPKITVGAPEGKDYYWDTPNTMYTSDSNPSGSPSSPGPLLRDYHYSLSENRFYICGLEGNAEGIDYRISITKGSESVVGSLPGMYVEIPDYYTGTVSFGPTPKQQYETKSIIITKTNNNALVIIFKPIGSAHTLGQWTVNSIVIERIENGIMIK